MAQLIGYTGLAILAGIVVWLIIANRKESAKRKALPPEQRARLEREGAVWSQRHGV